MRRRPPRRASLAGWMAAALLTACGANSSDDLADPPTTGQAASPAAPVVTVATVTAAPLVVTDVFPGRVTPVRVAEIRPQVTGIVTRRLFEQGADVRAGQALFTLQSAPFKAEAAMAAATLQRAEVALRHAQGQVARLQPLAEARAVSQQAFDEVRLQRDQAAAEVAQAKATLERRELDVAFATVQAPISGRVDQALQTEGALVSATDATPLARIVQIDQVYVDVRQPAGALEQVRGQVAAERTVTLLRSDGSPMDARGRVLFSGISVDASTGDVLVRVLVDNPRHELLPGMFVRARMPSASYAQALMVRQEAVVRSGDAARVWRLDAQGVVHAVPVQLAELVEGQWRIASGLKAGDRYVLSGLDKLSEGLTVTVAPPVAPPATPPVAPSVTPSASLDR